MKRHFTSIISQLFGSFANTEFTPIIQKMINKSYIRMMQLDMIEFKLPSQYKTLNKLFSRELLKDRIFNKDENIAISPSDSLITDYGKIEEGKAYQIKGMEYNISNLFGENHTKVIEDLKNGYFINFYLSPKDYHRFHMPLTLNILSLTHLPGKLYPVNIPFLNRKQNLFIENERVIIEAKDNHNNSYVLVCVGALNVGKIFITFEKNINTNIKATEIKHFKYENLTLQKGELFGWFEMGSTILLFSSRNIFSDSLKINQQIKFGDSL